MGMQQSQRIGSLEWWLAGEEEVSGSSQGVQVAGWPDVGPARLLRAEIGRGAEDAAGLREAGVRTACVRDQAEVEQFAHVEPPAEGTKHDLGRLHVPVHQTEGVGLA